MAPLIRDQLPILKQLIKWFTKEGVIIDSLVFRLHHQVNILRSRFICLELSVSRDRPSFIVLPLLSPVSGLFICNPHWICVHSN